MVARVVDMRVHPLPTREVSLEGALYPDISQMVRHRLARRIAPPHHCSLVMRCRRGEGLESGVPIHAPGRAARRLPPANTVARAARPLAAVPRTPRRATQAVASSRMQQPLQGLTMRQAARRIVSSARHLTFSPECEVHEPLFLCLHADVRELMAGQ